MSAVWNDSVLVEAFHHAMRKYQEGLSKSGSNHGKPLDVENSQGDEGEGCSYNPEDRKEEVTLEQVGAELGVSGSVLSEGEGITSPLENHFIPENYHGRNSQEEQPLLRTSFDDGLPAKLSRQQPQDLEQEQEQLFEQLYILSSSMFGKGTNWSDAVSSQHIVPSHSCVCNAPVHTQYAVHPSCWWNCQSAATLSQGCSSCGYVEGQHL